MNWSNFKYILRAGVLSILLIIPGLASAICGTDTIIKNYKPDSVRIVIKSDSVIAYHTGDSLFTILQADSVISDTKESIGHTVCVRIGSASFLHIQRYNLRETWDCYLSEQVGITESIISGKRICCSDFYQNIRRKRQRLQ